MLDTILSIGASFLSGGATGIIGVLAQRYFDWKAEQLKLEAVKVNNQHALAMIEANGKLMDREWRGRAEVAKTEGDTARDVADAAAFAASYNTEPKSFLESQKPVGGKIGKTVYLLMGITDMVRGLVRPGLTVYLCVLTTLIYLRAELLIDKHGMTMDSKDAFELVKYIIYSVLYLTTTVTLWWFGTRNKSEQPKMRGA